MAKTTASQPLRSAIVTVSAEGSTQSFELRDVDFSQSRDEAAIGIGRVIIDHIYAFTEGKRAAK